MKLHCSNSSEKPNMELTTLLQYVKIPPAKPVFILAATFSVQFPTNVTGNWLIFLTTVTYVRDPEVELLGQPDQPELQPLWSFKERTNGWMKFLFFSVSSSPSSACPPLLFLPCNFVFEMKKYY